MSETEDILFDVFAHPGWREFQRRVAEQLKAAKESCHTANSPEEFFVRKGRIQILENISSFEDAYRMETDAAEYEWEPDA